MKRIMTWFLNSNEPLARASRTAAEGAMSTIISWAAAAFAWDWCYLLATMIPVVLSPVMAALGELGGNSWLLSSNDPGARALRASIQGVLSTISAWAAAAFTWNWIYLLAAMIPVALAPIMQYIGFIQAQNAAA